ncbi:5-formyltetrahydrofolate cyclo-ligase [Acidisphaera sp. S103]|uniref:5-formyltetrahydrofolate cyclo-ligase n=1 Tax=Acidisphaera sp. S103 TaxID=1747223 RepID=UPI00131A8A72|nr:5-formyltetrahydrofolate cyclo-ligase [Acidisphaera sp. S103]
MDPTVNAWRKAQRTQLLGQRQSLSPDDRLRAAEVIGEQLSAIVAANGIVSVGLYWPIKQEISLLAWANELAGERNVVLCLPVVVTPKEPLEYWRWTQGEPLARGIWNIPVPAERDVVLPDLMLAPVVGFDRANYRLGYGGGYFDRTLASLRRRPMVVGIGYAFSALETIFPQTHDIPMDAVLTDTPMPLEQP